MSSRLARRVSDMEDDEVDEDVSGSQSSDASSDGDERAQQDRDNDENLSEDDEVPRPRLVNGAIRKSRPANRENGDAGGLDKFQPGAIVRVKLKDFVTYSSAEFFPGPSLNMVIGPNGTGKSSLVCAICLGLGWLPKILGRGGEVGEFVKHNCDYAEIEIELQGKTDDSRDNRVVGLRITKEGNGRDWKLDGRKTTFKAIQELMRSLHIQIDNLCQFLPQDKVAAFAAMDTIALLDATQRAACPEQMLEWHEKLKGYRKEQKSLQDNLEQDKEQLQGNESRLATMRADADKLEEINAIKVKVSRLEKTIPFIEYKVRRLEWLQQKAQKAEAVRNLEALEAQVAPTLASIDRKKNYEEQILLVVDQCKKSLHLAEKAADTTLNEITKLDENIKEFEQQAKAEKDTQKPRLKDILKFRDQIRKAEEALKDPPKEFISAEWNDQIRAIQREVREVESKYTDLKTKHTEAQDRGRVLRAGMDEIDQELNGLNTQEGQQMTRVDSINKEVGTAWKWIQKNRHEFEKDVYGPPLIECSISDPKYTAAVEALLGQQDILCFTAQTPADYAKLNYELLGGDRLALADITIRSVYDTLAEQKPPLPRNEMQQFGLDGWALDYIDGPEPVLAMLCAAKGIHRSGIALASITEQQHNGLVNSNCNSWITGRHFYKVSKRAEYGPQATSTATRGIQGAKFWIDAPVNSSAKQELEIKREALRAEFEILKEGVTTLKKDMAALKEEGIDLHAKQTQKEEEKKAVQTVWGQFVTLPKKIEKDRATLVTKEKELEGLKQQIEKIYVNQDNTVIIRKAGKVLDYKRKVESIRSCHAALLEATIRLIEAQSDVESLTERNIETMHRVERERTIARESEEAFKIARAKAKIAINAVNQIKREAEDAADGSAEYFLSNEVAPEGMTVEIRETEIRAEQNKLNFMHAGNPHAIEAYEAFKSKITKLQDKITSAESTLEELDGNIAEIRGKWEPQLDKVIKEISDAFAYNFEQIGCAGEVGVRKDEDFEKWEIQIKVKFRSTETLQILDQHRQSGGERSVSTIFYLMALQSLAKSPFRVVDEINQGMDPRNERMVHERMVDIACKEHTSQYFLITPKLLTGLRYDKRMKVHCIASGEFMPPDYKKLDARKIINLRRALMAHG